MQPEAIFAWVEWPLKSASALTTTTDQPSPKPLVSFTAPPADLKDNMVSGELVPALVEASDIRPALQVDPAEEEAKQAAIQAAIQAVDAEIAAEQGRKRAAEAEDEFADDD